MEINKKQAGTILIAAIFIISGISFAISWSPPAQQTGKSPNVIEQPIANEQRSVFLNSDVTILTLFYLEDDGDSLKLKKTVERLNDEIGEKLLVEEINIRTYQSFSAEYNVKTVPTTLIRGKENIQEPLRMEGLQEYAELKGKICTTYEEKPGSCG
ncbi:MAG: hypothetical protein JSV92_04665 [archaeon]|nr:MAG: hypothetical protein JSV92_04665 [archaeon]